MRMRYKNHDNDARDARGQTTSIRAISRHPRETVMPVNRISRALRLLSDGVGSRAT